MQASEFFKFLILTNDLLFDPLSKVCIQSLENVNEELE